MKKKICVLSGGTGTPKLLWGLKFVFDDFFVIVNTADDVWLSGLKICPDIDSVIYTLSELIDTKKWWGLRDDTFNTNQMLRKLGFDEYMMIGDRDRAIHIIRTSLLKKGLSLTDVTRILASKFGLKNDVLPMCDEEVFTQICTPIGPLHFQEFWVKYKGQLDVLDIRLIGINESKLNPYTKNLLLYNCDVVIIGPSNPITSITPIISVKNVKKYISDKFVVAISPIIGEKPVSGPAGKFMRVKGFDVSPLGVIDVYSNFLDILIVDTSDKKLEGKVNGVNILSAPILIKNRKDAVMLSIYVKKIISKYL